MHRTQSGAVPPPEQVVRAYVIFYLFFVQLFAQKIKGLLCPFVQRAPKKIFEIYRLVYVLCILSYFSLLAV